MLFGWFISSRRKALATARRLYARSLARSREPVFYGFGGVPDTLDGRFDLLLLHLFPVMDRLVSEKTSESAALAQALFDVMFKDMENAARERGIGDLGVPRHVKRMMLAFNGRMEIYRTAMAGPDMIASVREALRRNLYGTAPGIGEDSLDMMAAYLFACHRRIRQMDLATLLGGAIDYAPPSLMIRGGAEEKRDVKERQAA